MRSQPAGGEKTRS